MATSIEVQGAPVSLGQADEQTLLDLVSASVPVDQPVAESTPLFLPYLASERTPHNDPLLRGGFMNLGHDSTPAKLGYAVLEGLGFRLLDAMNATLSAGARVKACALVGGGARSKYWAQLLANILDREVYTLHGSELSACIGAAKLEWLAIGQGQNLLQMGLPIKARYHPLASVQPAIRARHAKFCGMLPAARGLHG